MSNQSTTSSDESLTRKTFTVPYNVKRNASFYPGVDSASPEMMDSIAYLLENVANGLDTISLLYKNTKLVKFELVTQQGQFQIDRIKNDRKNLEINVLNSGERMSRDVFEDTRFSVYIAISDDSAQITPVDTLGDLEKKVKSLKKEVDKKREENGNRFCRIKLLLTDLNTTITRIAEQEEAHDQINGLEKRLDGILVDGNIDRDAAQFAYKEAIEINHKYRYQITA